MKNRMHLRLMLKLAGVLLVGLTIDTVLRDVIDLLQAAIYTDEWFGSPPNSSTLGELLTLGYWLLTVLSPMLTGLYLVFGGEWLIRRLVPLNRKFCEHCGYHLAGVAHRRCPECGVRIDTAAQDDQPETASADGD